MTTHIHKECNNCLTDYSFQGSGWGAPEFNDSTYCPECKEAICTALKTIPKKFKYVWVDTKDFTFKEACDCIDEDEKKLKAKEDADIDRRQKCPKCDLISPFVGLKMRRVFMPLFNMDTMESSIVNHFIRNGEEYSLIYFKSDPTDYRLKKNIKHPIGA